MDASLPLLVAVDLVSLLAVRKGESLCDSVHVRCIAAVMHFREAKGHAERVFELGRDEFRSLGGCAEVIEHEDVGEIADDGVFVLEVIGQT